MLTSPRDRISSGGPTEDGPLHSCDEGPERRDAREEEEEEQEEEAGEDPRETTHRHPKDQSIPSCKRKLELGWRGDAHVSAATQPESPPPAKRWVIGPLFQSFRSKMASFTEIVMSPVRLFTEGTGAPGDGAGAVTQRLRFVDEGGDEPRPENGAPCRLNSPEPERGSMVPVEVPVQVPVEVQDPFQVRVEVQVPVKVQDPIQVPVLFPVEVQDPVQVLKEVQVPVQVRMEVQVPVKVQDPVQVPVQFPLEVRVSPTKASESPSEAVPCCESLIVDRTHAAPRRRNAGNSRRSQANGTNPTTRPEGSAPARAARVKSRVTRRRRKPSPGGDARPAPPPETEPGPPPGAQGGGVSAEDPGTATSLTLKLSDEVAEADAPPTPGGVGVCGHAPPAWAWSGAGRQRRRSLKRSLSCPDISAHALPSTPPSPKRPCPPPRRERRHTVCSLEVEREIAPLCLRKEVHPSWARARSPSRSLAALVSCFLSSPLAFLSRRSGVGLGVGGGHAGSPATPAVLADAAHVPGDSAAPPHSRVFDPVPTAPADVVVPRESGVCEAAPAAPEDKALSDSDVQADAKGAERRKVSSIRIRRTLPKPQYSLTPMGLPRALRVKKKVFSVEEIYTNKNFTKPPEGRLETIFEFPLSRRDGSESLFGPRRMKRVVDFPEVGVARKPRRPPAGGGGAQRKGAGNSGRTRRGAGGVANLGLDSDSLLRSKLSELDTWMRRDRAVR